LSNRDRSNSTLPNQPNNPIPPLFLLQSAARPCDTIILCRNGLVQSLQNPRPAGSNPDR
jgi:hypothetical protein